MQGNKAPVNFKNLRRLQSNDKLEKLNFKQKIKSHFCSAIKSIYQMRALWQYSKLSYYINHLATEGGNIDKVRKMKIDESEIKFL